MFNNLENNQNSVRNLGEILINDLGIPKSIIDEGLMLQKKINDSANKMIYNRISSIKSLGDILIENGIVSRDKVYRALAIQKNLNFIPASVVKGVVNYKLYRTPEFGALYNNRYDEILNSIFKSESFPSHYETDENGDPVLVFIATDPDKISEVNIFLSKMVDKSVKTKIVITDNSVYSEFKLKYKAITRDELEYFSKQVDVPKEGSNEILTTKDFLKYLLCYAILEKVSDIHFFPSSNRLAKISVRKFGTLTTLFYISYELYSKIMRAVKTEAKMKENIVYVPQDGRIDGIDLLKNVEIKLNRPNAIVQPGYQIDENHLKYDFSSVSFRISTYPTEPNIKMDMGLTFEKLVIRVLNLSAGLTELEDLGLSEQSIRELNRLKNRTQGVILIVGPTGSGKSTTLYSMMSSINCLEKSVITFEDPVEMRQLNWAQGQRKVVKDNDEQNFDFNEATKSILRQDPDIIMMAEVRDEDTAKFTISAANTGHLVLTTLHSNSASSAVERLKKLGVYTADISSSVLCVMSQRLVKKICPHCRKEIEVTQEQKELLKKLDLPEEKIPLKAYKRDINGCMFCNHIGYVGVIAINEIIPFFKEMKALVEKGAGDIEIRTMASSHNYKTILEDGMEKTTNGLCDIDDVINVL